MVERIGVFGGTFDPPHIGHVHLIERLRDYHRLDRVLVVPAHANPLKDAQTSFVHRLAMARLAFEGVEGAEVIDIEGNRSPPSYTVDTLREISAHLKGENDELFLLMGEDTAAGFHLWKSVEEIVRLAQPVVARRESAVDLGELTKHPALWKAISPGITPTTLVSVSSTALRESLCSGTCSTDLIPPNVFVYIQEHALYIPSDSEVE